MNKLFNLILVLTIFLTSCNTNKNESANVLPDNTLFSISPTTDPAFCSADSIVGTDCGIGDLYLTKDGNVLYSPFCMGMDTFTYYIGKYNISDTGIVCSFKSEYSYPMGCYDCPENEIKPEDPNSGKTTVSKEWFLILKKTNCKDFPYFISNSQDEYHQALKIEQDKNYYCETISKIKSLSEFHCSFIPSKKTSDNLIDEEIITKILIYYSKHYKNGIPQREETDSLINLSFKEKKEDDMPYSNLTISKIKSDYLFGDINNDGKKDIIASVGADGGGSASWNELFVFINENDNYILKSVTSSFDLAVCKKGSHEGQFYPKEIKDGIVIGTSICYTDEDAHCCPSIKKESKAVFKNDKLIKTK